MTKATGDMDATVQALMASPRGILAADERNSTIAQRFEVRSIERAGRDLRSGAHDVVD